jgi:Htaa
VSHPHSIRALSPGGRRPLGLGGLVAAIAVVSVAVLPAGAKAAGGATTLATGGPAAEALRASGVRIAPLKPARGGSRRVLLPVAAGLAGAKTTLLRHRGGIVLQVPGGKALRLTDLRLVLGKRSRLSAKLGGREIDAFKLLGGERDIDPTAGTVELVGSRLKLTRAGASAIAAGLKPKGGQARNSRRPAAVVKPGFFGALSVQASGLTAGSSAPAGAAPPAQKSSGCPLPSGAGPAPAQPPPVATRPPGAVDVIGATIDWHVRESFIRYVSTGEGTSPLDGASADPPVLLPGASSALSYTFHFPFVAGWHDGGANPSDPADDRAALQFGGGVRFLYSEHWIDLVTAKPEIEIAGPDSRAIFAISESGGAAERQVLVNLDLSKAATIAASGNTLTYERVPGAIPSGTASSVFAGFYAPGTEFGCFTVSYTTGP